MWRTFQEQKILPSPDRRRFVLFMELWGYSTSKEAIWASRGVLDQILSLCFFLLLHSIKLQPQVKIIDCF